MSIPESDTGEIHEHLGEIQKQLSGLEAKVENHRNEAATGRREFHRRLEIVEAKLPGHSDEDLVRMIDARVETALHDSPTVSAIRGDIATIKTSTDPIVEIHKHVMAVGTTVKIINWAFRGLVVIAVGCAAIFSFYMLIVSM